MGGDGDSVRARPVHGVEARLLDELLGQGLVLAGQRPGPVEGHLLLGDLGQTVVGGGRVVEIQSGRPVAVPGGAVRDRPGQNEAPLLLGLGNEGGYLGCLGIEGGLAD